MIKGLGEWSHEVIDKQLEASKPPTQRRTDSVKLESQIPWGRTSEFSTNLGTHWNAKKLSVFHMPKAYPPKPKKHRVPLKCTKTIPIWVIAFCPPCLWPSSHRQEGA